MRFDHSINTAWGLLSSIWVGGLGIFAFPIYTRQLGSEAIGIIGFSLIIYSCLTLFEVGWSQALLKSMSLQPVEKTREDRLSKVLASMELIYALIVVLCILFFFTTSEIISEYWLESTKIETKQISIALKGMGFVIGFQLLQSMYKSALIGLERQAWLSKFLIILSSAKVIATIIAIDYISSTIITFVVVHFFFSCAEVLILRMKMKKIFDWKMGDFRTVEIKMATPFVIGVTASTFLAMLSITVDRIILSKTLTLSEFGEFTLAMTIIGGLSMLVSPVFNNSFAGLSAIAPHDHSKYKYITYKRFIHLMIIIIMPAACVLITFGHEIILLWTGDMGLADRISPIVSIWATGTAMNALVHIPYSYQLSSGQVRFSMRINAISAVFAIPALLLLVPNLGAIGAAWIWVTVNIFQLTAYFWINQRNFPDLKSDSSIILEIIIPIACLASLAEVLSSYAHLTEHDGRFESILFIIGAGVVFFITAVACTSTGRHMAISIFFNILLKCHIK